MKEGHGPAPRLVHFGWSKHVMFGAAAGCAQQVKIQRAGSTLRAHLCPGYHRKISAGSLCHSRAKAAQLQLRGAAPSAAAAPTHPSWLLPSSQGQRSAASGGAVRLAIPLHESGVELGKLLGHHRHVGLRRQDGSAHMEGARRLHGQEGGEGRGGGTVGGEARSGKARQGHADRSGKARQGLRQAAVWHSCRLVQGRSARARAAALHPHLPKA